MTYQSITIDELCVIVGKPPKDVWQLLGRHDRYDIAEIRRFCPDFTDASITARLGLCRSVRRLMRRPVWVETPPPHTGTSPASPSSE